MRAALRLLFGTLLGLFVAGSALAQGRVDLPGRFDFYVLALSWSPSFCEDEGRDEREQCGRRPYAFVVHGLWPQNERGWPEYCGRAADNARAGRDRTGVPYAVVERMLPLMPSRALIAHQWEKHGTCSGLSVEGYFSLVEAAREHVAIPSAFERLSRPLRTSPAAIEAAFVAANPALSDGAIAVICRGNRVREVRLCLDKSLGFRTCEEVDRRSCTRRDVVMPPVRSAS